MDLDNLEHLMLGVYCGSYLQCYVRNVFVSNFLKNTLKVFLTPSSIMHLKYSHPMLNHL